MKLQSIKKLRSLWYTWYGDRVCNNLKRGVASGNVKMSLKMLDLKPLHANWIVEMYYDDLKQQKGSILSRLDKAGVTETAKSAIKVFAKIENLFPEKL